MARNTTERIRDGGRGLAHTVRENPLPAALIAAGIGWLVWSSRSRHTNGISASVPDVPLTDTTPDFTPASAELSTSSSDGVGYGTGLLRQNVTGQAANGHAGVAETARRFKERAGAVSHRVADTARSAGSRVAQTARNTGHRVASTARSTAHRVENKYNESPIALGAVAGAVGLAIGLSLPATRKEERMIGGTGEKLLDKARGAVSSATARAEDIARRAAPEVKAVLRDAARQETSAPAQDTSLSSRETSLS
jgi:hypothetical protein